MRHMTLYIDQYGQKWFAQTVKDLRNQVGGGRVSKMYRDKPDGSAVHVGYVIGKLWLGAWHPVEHTVENFAPSRRS